MHDVHYSNTGCGYTVCNLNTEWDGDVPDRELRRNVPTNENLLPCAIVCSNKDATVGKGLVFGRVIAVMIA